MEKTDMKINPVKDRWISDQARETYEGLLRQCEIEIRHVTGIDDGQFGLNATQILELTSRKTQAETAAQVREIQRYYGRLAAAIYRDFTVPIVAAIYRDFTVTTPVVLEADPAP